MYKEGQIVFLGMPVKKKAKELISSKGLVIINKKYKKDFDQKFHYKGEKFWPEYETKVKVTPVTPVVTPVVPPVE